MLEYIYIKKSDSNCDTASNCCTSDKDLKRVKLIFLCFFKSLNSEDILSFEKGTFTIFDKILNFHGVVNLIITR